MSAIGGVDYVESTSRAGVSTVTVRLKLNHNSTASAGRGHCATAAGARGAAGRGRAAGGRGAARRSALRDVLSQLHFAGAQRTRGHRLAVAHAAAAALDARRRAARELSRAADRSPCGSGSTPIDSRRSTSRRATCTTRLRRNNYLAAVGQTKGNLVQVNLLANTDLRSVGRVREPHRRRPRRRHRAAERRGAGRARRRRSRHGRQVQRPGERLPRRLAAGRLERDRGGAAPARRDGAHPADAAGGHRHAAGLGRHHVHAQRAEGDHQDAGRDDADRRPGRVPVHGLGAHGAGAAGGDAGLADRRGDRDVRVRLQPQPA